MDKYLGTRIDVRGRLVEYQQAAIRQQRAGDGQQLLLSAGDAGRILTDNGVIALRQSADEVIAVGFVAGGDYLLPRCVRTAVGDVVGYGAAEEPCVLKHHAEQRADIVARSLGNVVAVDAYAAAVDIVKSHEQVDYRGLARAGGADDGDLLPALYIDIEVADERRVLAVREADVLKFHVALDVGGDVAALLRLLLGVQHVEHALRRGLGALEIAHAVGYLLQRRGKLPRKQHHRHDNADAHAAFDDEHAAEDADYDVRKRV